MLSLHADSRNATASEPVDVVISETLGEYALEENVLEILQDAGRLLKPSGVMIPSRLRQFVAPVVGLSGSRSE